MVKYRQHKFLSTWASREKRIVVFSKDSSWSKALGLRERKKPLVLVTYDETIFSANDRKRKV